MFTTIDNLNTTISFPLKVEGLTKDHVGPIFDKIAGSELLTVSAQHAPCSPVYVIHDEPILVLGVISETVNHQFHFQRGLEGIFIANELPIVKGSDFRKQGNMFHLQHLYQQCHRLRQLGMLNNSVEEKAMELAASTDSGHPNAYITIFDYFHIEAIITAPVRNIGEHIMELATIIKSTISPERS